MKFQWSLVSYNWAKIQERVTSLSRQDQCRTTGVTRGLGYRRIGYPRIRESTTLAGSQVCTTNATFDMDIEFDEFSKSTGHGP